MFCVNCGGNVDSGHAFCPHCGAKVDERVSAQSADIQNADLQNAKPAQRPEDRQFYKAGFVLGVLSLAIPIYGFILGIIGIPLACVSRRVSSIVMNCISVCAYIILIIVLLTTVAQ